MAWDEVFGRIEPDGLPYSEAGSWAEEKHKLLAHYATLFVRSMRGKWGELVYLDLFSGAGAFRVRDTTRYYRSSPTIVYSLEDAFDSYVYCDADISNANALQTRLGKVDLKRKFSVLSGDANALTGRILALVPQGNKDLRTLSFCFLDPFKIGNLKFETIRRLSERYMDFLVLIPSGMDAHRNVQTYTRADIRTLDEFLGNSEWRLRWDHESSKGTPFEQFVVTEFGRSMGTLGYIDPGLQNVATIRSQEKNLLLYRLALYSRHKLGAKFWKETQKYTNPQVGWDF